MTAQYKEAFEAQDVQNEPCETTGLTTSGKVMFAHILLYGVVLV